MCRPGRREGRRAPRRAAAATLTAIITALALMPAAARAETAITTQATADDGAFLPYAPAPAQPAGLCLVDTGVNLNPDTEGVLVERTALGGGEGEDVSPTLHGTVMAMMAAAPVNGWGMVGTAPGAIKIVSVGILEAGATTFPFSAYGSGITDCLEMRKRFNIRVINLSLGTSEVPSSEAYEALANSVGEATDNGVAIVAAAGNDDGGLVEYPAAYPGVLSVGASNAATGEWCSFSNRGEGLRLIAPGCDLDAADPTSGVPDENYFQGTSEASAITAAALTALYAYAPSLSVQAAEEDVSAAHSGVLDIAQSFRNAGLASVVSAGETAEPKARTPHAPSAASPPSPSSPAGAAPVNSADPLTPPQQVAPSSTMSLSEHLPRPRARLLRVRHRYRLLLHGQPDEAQTQVRYYRRRAHHHRQVRTRTGSFTRLLLPTRGLLAVRVRYIDPYDIQRDSPWLTLRPRHLKRNANRGKKRR